MNFNEIIDKENVSHLNEFMKIINPKNLINKILNITPTTHGFTGMEFTSKKRIHKIITSVPEYKALKYKNTKPKNCNYSVCKIIDVITLPLNSPWG